MTTVSVDELARAWAAVRAGQFRTGTLREPAPERAACSQGEEAQAWVPGHLVLPVLAAHGGAGATTTALALATAYGAARVVEAASLSASGLTGAATAELGHVGGSWLRGTRDQVVLDRPGRLLAGPHEVPMPVAASGVDLSVLDGGWEAGSISLSSGWLARSVYPSAGGVVLVARATVPGVRHLEGALHLLAGRDPVAAVIGPLRRWPATVRAAMGDLTRRLDEQGALVRLPYDQGLGVTGLDTTPLPSALVAGATKILQLIGLEAPTTTNRKVR